VRLEFKWRYRLDIVARQNYLECKEGGTKSESKSPKATLNTHPPQTTKYITADASLVEGYRAKVYVKICRGGGCFMSERFMLLVNYIVQAAIKEWHSVC
jgi:hypothetical protein